MDASSPPSDAERELNELRARAYGPLPDIQGDPAALARLAELEAAHRARPPGGGDADGYGSEIGAPEIGAPAAVEDEAPVGDSAATAPTADRPDSAAATPVVVSSGDSPRSRWRRLTATRAGRSSVVAGALVAVLVIAYTVVWLVGPHPDATLRPSADEADGVVFSLIDFLGDEADPSTLRGYQPYEGVEPWFFESMQGFHCFMIVTRPSFVDGANCVPPGVDLFADIGPWPGLADDDGEALPEGSIIRFHYRGDSVDVFLYPAYERD